MGRASRTDDGLLHEVLVAPRRAFVPMPDTRVIERPGWMQLVTPSLRTGGLNEVSLAVLTPETAEAGIAEALAPYRELGLRFRWTVGPDSAPADLVRRLQAEGLALDHVHAMARSSEPLPTPSRPGVTIESVTETELDAFTDVMAEGWGASPGPLRALNERLLASPGPRLFLGRDEGRPVAAAGLFVLPSSALLQGAVVLPGYRGRGLFRALVAARIDEARRLGRPLVTCHANARTSAPILARLGFREVCRLPMLTG